MKRAGALKSNAFSVQPTAVNTIGSLAGAKCNYSFRACGICIRALTSRRDRQRKMIAYTRCQEIARAPGSDEEPRPRESVAARRRFDALIVARE